MWSCEFTGRKSPIQGSQRVEIPIEWYADEKDFIQDVEHGCRSVFIKDISCADDLKTLATGIQKSIYNETIERSDFSITARCSVSWTAETLVEEFLKLQVHIDLLLLPSCCVIENHSVSLDKMILAWSQMIELKQKGSVRSIGVSNFSIFELEYLLNRNPEHPPVVHEITSPISLHSQAKELVNFCQAHEMDVIAHVLIDGNDVKNQKVIEMAAKHSTLSFKSFVATEGILTAKDKPRNVSRTLVKPKTALQVLLIYFLQRGMVLIPRAKRKPDRFDQMHALLHPLARLDPEFSPSTPHTFFLSREEMDLLSW